MAGNLIEEVLPLLKGRQVLLFFDSWYAKSSLMEQFLQYPQLDIVCNIRSDSEMYELPPLPNKQQAGTPEKTRETDSSGRFYVVLRNGWHADWSSHGSDPYLWE